MSYVKIMVHCVWGTKYREPLLSKQIRTLLIDHIKQNAKTKGIFIDRINGYTEHLHCLIGLNADMSISKAMQLIKGESSFWINKEKILNSKFEWAKEYFAISVSESVLNSVRTYIENQEEHHNKTTFQQEYDEFIAKYKFNESK
ncbi:MAG: IS200/IS605 family transposase [Saprospiraceae bacterium]